MPLRTHELHPTLIHGPLALLPAAAAVDMVAANTGSPILHWLGGRLWIAGAATGLTAGLAGMAASQEVKIDDRKVQDMMYLHGIGNLALVIGAAAMGAWRLRRRATRRSALTGAAAIGAALYTAYLGGELVYGHGVGIKAKVDGEAHLQSSPPVLSPEGPRRFLRDAFAGLFWLFRRSGEAVSGERPIEPRAGAIEPMQRALGEAERIQRPEPRA